MPALAVFRLQDSIAIGDFKQRMDRLRALDVRQLHDGLTQPPIDAPTHHNGLDRGEIPDF
jgi:hypothetical protein